MKYRVWHNGVCIVLLQESMLSELQSGVDIEIGNWRKRVEEKDTELSQLQKKLLELDSTLVEHGFVKEIVEQARLLVLFESFT